MLFLPIALFTRIRQKTWGFEKVLLAGFSLKNLFHGMAVMNFFKHP
jgi:hypothetical protein